MIRTIHNPIRAARLAAAKAFRTRVRRILAPAVVRYRNGAALTAALTAGTLATISTHLAALGADEELCRRFASHAGKKVRAAFEQLTGRTPLRVWTVRNGRPIEVFVYAPGDPALKLGFRAYGRTAHLVTT